MKNSSFIVSTILIAVVATFLTFCTNNSDPQKNQSGKNNAAFTTIPFIEQLFIFQENKEQNPSNSRFVSGAMYLTKKGNIIYNIINEQQDTVNYFWGKYTLTDTSLSYLLTNEFYFPGKWDARWDIPDPDYLKGKTRKVICTQVTLNRSKGDSLSFFKRHTIEEINIALKDNYSSKTFALSYFPYYETKEMKFYSWFYKQVPILAQL
jgi:hypothetical protein